MSVRDDKVRLGAFPLALIGDLGRALSQVELPAEDEKAPTKATKPKKAPTKQPVSAPKPAAKAASKSKKTGS